MNNEFDRIKHRIHQRVLDSFDAILQDELIELGFHEAELGQVLDKDLPQLLPTLDRQIETSFRRAGDTLPEQLSHDDAVIERTNRQLAAAVGQERADELRLGGRA